MNEKITLDIRCVVTDAKTNFGEIFIDGKIVAYLIELPSKEFSVIDTEGDTLFIADNIKEAGLKAAAYILSDEEQEECNCPVCQISRQINLMQ